VVGFCILWKLLGFYFFGFPLVFLCFFFVIPYLYAFQGLFILFYLRFTFCKSERKNFQLKKINTENQWKTLPKPTTRTVPVVGPVLLLLL